MGGLSAMLTVVTSGQYKLSGTVTLTAWRHSERPGGLGGYFGDLFFVCSGTADPCSSGWSVGNWNSVLEEVIVAATLIYIDLPRRPPRAVILENNKAGIEALGAICH